MIVALRKLMPGGSHSGSLLVALALGVVTGCSLGRELPDPRKYFDRTEPLSAALAFSWGVETRKWDYVSDCLFAAGGLKVSKADCRALRAALDKTDKSRADVLEDGDRAVVTLPATAAGTDSAEYSVHLLLRENVRGVRLWLVDVPTTLERNASRE